MIESTRDGVCVAGSDQPKSSTPSSFASSARRCATTRVWLVALLALPGAGVAAERAAEPRTEPAASEAPPAVVPQRDLERALSAPRTRGLRIAPRTDAAAAAPAAAAGEPVSTAPAAASVALDVPFEIDSSALRPAAAAQLQQLAGALKSSELEPFRFLIAGHTDASGDATYNRRLSGRRADAVRRRLIEAGVAADRLDARGYGEDELLDPTNPRAAANRRVEIRNLGVTRR